MEACKPLFFWKLKFYKLTKCWVENYFLCPAKWPRDQKALNIFIQMYYFYIDLSLPVKSLKSPMLVIEWGKKKIWMCKTNAWEVAKIYRVGVAVYQTPCSAVLVRLHIPGHTCKDQAATFQGQWGARSVSDVLLLMGSQHSEVLGPFQECGGQIMFSRGPAWWQEAARAVLKDWGSQEALCIP